MVRRKVQRLFIGASCLGAAACSFVVSTADLTAGQSSPSSDASDDDAAQTIADGAVGSDVVIADGGTDAPVDAYCVFDAVFCDDFERAQVQGQWQSLATAVGGSLEIVPGTPTGRALRATAPPSDSGSDRGALTSTTIRQANGKVTIRSRVLVGTNEAAMHLNELHFAEPGGTYGLAFSYFIPNYGLVMAEFRCVQSNCNYLQTTPLAFSVGEWHDVALTVNFHTTPPSLALAVDAETLAAVSQLGLQPGTLTATAGVSLFEIPRGNAAVTIDDFAVTTD